MANLLVIDDEVVYLEYLARSLRLDGHAVQTASNGVEARERFAADRPDLVVVDWRLRSQEDGVALFKSLSADAPQLSGLLITGYSADEVRETLSDTKLYGPLEKPFRLADLSVSVEKILDCQPSLPEG